MPEDIDAALRQLRKLREGAGLSIERLARSPDLLVALGTPDPANAQLVLLQLLDQMGDSDRTRACRVDLGLDLERWLHRPPTSRERDRLGERRISYAVLVQRDAKTLRRWSDRCLRELRAQLITDYFDGHLVVAGGVKDHRLTGIEVLRYDREDTDLSHGQNDGHTNPEPGPSLPLMIFGFPREWQPATMRLVVAFLDDDLPSRVWALVADSVLDIGFGHERTELEVSNGMARCLIEQPRFDQLYGIWWE